MLQVSEESTLKQEVEKQLDKLDILARQVDAATALKLGRVVAVANELQLQGELGKGGGTS